MNISFSATTPQMRARTKRVTRRLGHARLKPGDLFWAVEKVRGLKKGEKVVRIAQCRVISNRPERLGAITTDEVTLEGFPSQSPEWFIAMFCKLNKCEPDQLVNRIEFAFKQEELSSR